MWCPWGGASCKGRTAGVVVSAGVPAGVGGPQGYLPTSEEVRQCFLASVVLNYRVGGRWLPLLPSKAYNYNIFAQVLRSRGRIWIHPCNLASESVLQTTLLHCLDFSLNNWLEVMSFIMMLKTEREVHKIKSSVLTMVSGRCLLAIPMEIASTKLDLEIWISGWSHETEWGHTGRVICEWRREEGPQLSWSFHTLHSHAAVEHALFIV